MRRFDRLLVWDSPGIAARLSWYRDVALDRRPAKFRIARTIPVDADPARDPEEGLRAALARATPRFLERWTAIKTGRADLPSGPPPHPNLLELCAALARRMLAHCNFCRWRCEVDRTSGEGAKLGACKLASDSRVSSFFHHRGEEIVYRGTEGSGTIFFTSCNMRCAFCQNGDISTDKENGEPVSARTLATMAWLLRKEGCHNVNWVGGEPTIHLHTIVEAIAMLADLRPAAGDLGRALGAKADIFARAAFDEREGSYAGEFNAPMLWNSNFFMSGEAMEILRVLMDVWLPDFKFGPGPCAIALARTPWYWETVTGHLRSIHAWGEDFTIRHLVMPEHVECCTRACLEWIAANMPDAPVNVMDQYHPDNFCDPRSPKFQEKYRPIARRPRRDEILRAFEIARALGLRYEALSFEDKNATGLRL